MKRGYIIPTTVLFGLASLYSGLSKSKKELDQRLREATVANNCLKTLRLLKINVRFSL